MQLSTALVASLSSIFEWAVSYVLDSARINRRRERLMEDTAARDQQQAELRARVLGINLSSAVSANANGVVSSSPAGAANSSLALALAVATSVKSAHGDAAAPTNPAPPAGVMRAATSRLFGLLSSGSASASTAALAGVGAGAASHAVGADGRPITTTNGVVIANGVSDTAATAPGSPAASDDENSPTCKLLTCPPARPASLVSLLWWCVLLFCCSVEW